MSDSEDGEFERRLLGAMRRVDAPEGFAQRTVERAVAEGRVEEAPRRAALLSMPVRGRVWMSGALAAGMLGGVFWAGEVHVRRERENAEKVQRQFEAAVQITDRALDHARAQLRQAGVGFGE